MVLVIFMFILLGKYETIDYVNSRSYIETMFVFVIMVIAGTRPILQTVVLLIKKYQMLYRKKVLLVLLCCYGYSASFRISYN